MINQQRLLETFLELITIDSCSCNEKEVADYVAGYLEGLGAEVFIDDSASKVGSNSGNIIAKINGKIKNKPILFNAHLDTVSPGRGIKPVINKGIITSKGKTILGADDKAGISIILEALTTILESKKDHVDIELAFTTAEETGLWGAKNLDYELIKSKICFSFDAGGDIGNIVVKAPSQDIIDATFYGKAAHAGVDPHKGINAIVAASKAIAKMSLGKVDHETTANVGIIKGGKATNIIPDKVSIKAETRSLDNKKLEKATNRMIEVINKTATEMGARAKVKVNRLYNSYAVGVDEEVVKICFQALGDLNISPKISSSCGGSDANLLNEKGIKSVVLSAGYHSAHSTDEYIEIAQLNKACELAVKIVECSSKKENHA